MESTAQYWKPVWLDLEPHFAKLHLAQAHSNRAPKGRKHDFGDGKRLTRRLLAGELIPRTVDRELAPKLASSFPIMIFWLTARRTTFWLRTLPVRPRALLFTIVSPLLLASAAGYFSGFHLGRHPRPAPVFALHVLELLAVPGWELTVILVCALWDWRRLDHSWHTVSGIAIFVAMTVASLGGSAALTLQSRRGHLTLVRRGTGVRGSRVCGQSPACDDRLLRVARLFFY